MAIWISLLAVGICLMVVFIAAARGLEVKQLLEDGVEGQGKVIHQRRRNQKGALGTNHYLRYEYVDSRGQRHEGKSKVSRDFWAAHPEGGPIDIVYSASKPAVSAPRFLVEQAIEAMAKKKG